MDVRLAEMEEDCREELSHIIKAIYSKLEKNIDKEHVSNSVKTIASQLPISVIDLARIQGMKELVMNKWSADILLGITQHYNQIKKRMMNLLVLQLKKKTDNDNNLIEKKENHGSSNTKLSTIKDILTQKHTSKPFAPSRKDKKKIDRKMDLFDSRCPLPNPKWFPKQQLMIGPIPVNVETLALHAALVSKGYILNLFIQRLHYTLPQSHPLSKFGQQTNVKFGYIVFREPEVAGKLLAEGYVMVDQVKVAVKEMDGEPAVVFKTSVARDDYRRNIKTCNIKSKGDASKMNKWKQQRGWNFKSSCPHPDPRWCPEQQLMIGPIPGDLQCQVISAAFARKGPIHWIFIQDNQAWLIKNKEKFTNEGRMERFVKFGYVVYTKVMVARRLLDIGFVMVGDTKVAVKEMDGKPRRWMGSQSYFAVEH